MRHSHQKEPTDCTAFPMQSEGANTTTLSPQRKVARRQFLRFVLGTYDTPDCAVGLHHFLSGR